MSHHKGTVPKGVLYTPHYAPPPPTPHLPPQKKTHIDTALEELFVEAGEYFKKQHCWSYEDGDRKL